MSVKVYSLADHIVTITLPSDYNGINIGNGNSLSIGGKGTQTTDGYEEGSFVGEISISRNENLFTTEGDYTGSWVHVKNNDKTGTVNINIKQVSDRVIQLIYLCRMIENNDNIKNGFSITVSSDGKIIEEVANCIDCFPVKIPDQKFGNTPDMQNWQFTCGQVNFSQGKGEN